MGVDGVGLALYIYISRDGLQRCEQIAEQGAPPGLEYLKYSKICRVRQTQCCNFWATLTPAFLQFMVTADVTFVMRFKRLLALSLNPFSSSSPSSSTVPPFHLVSSFVAPGPVHTRSKIRKKRSSFNHLVPATLFPIPKSTSLPSYTILPEPYPPSSTRVQRDPDFQPHLPAHGAIL